MLSGCLLSLPLNISPLDICNEIYQLATAAAWRSDCLNLYHNNTAHQNSLSHLSGGSAIIQAGSDIVIYLIKPHTQRVLCQEAFKSCSNCFVIVIKASGCILSEIIFDS